MEKRKTNWSFRELEELVCGMETHHSVLSSRFSHDVSNQQKNRCMEEIVLSVNAVGGANRTKEELLKKWSDLKSRTKKKEQERQKAIGMSGRGPIKKALEMNDIDLKVLNLLPKVTVYGIDGGFETGEKGSQKRKITDDKENNDAQKVRRTEDPLELHMSPVPGPSCDNVSGGPSINEGDNQKKKQKTVCHCSEDIVQIQREILEESRKRNDILTAINYNLSRIVDTHIESSVMESFFKT